MPRLLAVVLSSAVLAAPVNAAAPLVATEGWRPPILGAQRLPDAAPDLGRVAAQVRVIDAAEIGRSGARTLPELLSREAGVNLFDQVGNDYQQSADMRGFNATPVPATVVLVDGVRVNEADFGEVNWHLIPLGDVERVELHPGPATLYGRGALAGVVHVTTKRAGRGEAFSAESGASYGSFSRRSGWGAAQGTLGAFDWRFHMQREREAGWRDNSNADIGTVRLKAGWRPDAATDLSVSYERADDRLDQGGSVTGAELAVDRSANVSKVQTVSSLDMVTVQGRRSLFADVSLSADGHWRGRRQDTPYNLGRTSTSRSLSNMASRGGTVQLARPGEVWGRALTLAAGVEGGRTEADADSSGSFGVAPFKSGSLVKDDSLGLFTQATLDLVPDQLTATAGFRYDENRMNYEDKVNQKNNGGVRYRRASPRLGLTLNPTPDLTLYASYAEAFRAPTALELTAVGPLGAAPLNPVQTRSTELGLRARPSEATTAALALFRTVAVDEIYFDPTAGAFGTNVNVPKTQRLGLEWSAGWEGERWSARASHAYTEATFDSAVTLSGVPFGVNQKVEKWKTLPMVPENRGTLEVAFKPAAGWRVATDGLCVDSQRMVADEANQKPELPGYCVANLGASWQRGAWTLGLRGTNITDARYQTRGIIAAQGGAAQRFYVPAAGIGVSASAAWRWGAEPAAKTAKRGNVDALELARRAVGGR